MALGNTGFAVSLAVGSVDTVVVVLRQSSARNNDGTYVDPRKHDVYESFTGALSILLGNWQEEYKDITEQFFDSLPTELGGEIARESHVVTPRIYCMAMSWVNSFLEIHKDV